MVTTDNFVYSPWAGTGTTDYCPTGTITNSTYDYCTPIFSSKYTVPTANYISNINCTSTVDYVTGSAITDYLTKINYTCTTGSPYEAISYTPIKYKYWDISDESWEWRKKNEAIARMKNNLVIQVKSRANLLPFPDISEPECRALETLREMITEEEFRKYLRYGFILVKGQSGVTYQIFRDRAHCRVWSKGIVIEEVCVRITDQEVPKTDKVIALKTIIETSEEEFKKLGNVYKMATAA